MCHNRKNNSKVNRLHERCLRIICHGQESSFEELLEEDGFDSIHNRNLQKLATKTYKVSKGLSPTIMTELFELRKSTLIISDVSQFNTPSMNTVP